MKTKMIIKKKKNISQKSTLQSRLQKIIKIASFNVCPIILL